MSPTPSREEIETAKALILRHRRAAISVSKSRRPLPDTAPYPSSYLGGLPCLPRGVRWPRFRRQEMTFIGQFDLADLPAITGNPLPKSGRLLFFSFTQFTRHPGDKAKWSKVIYLPPGAKTKRRAPPRSLMRMVSAEPWLFPWLPDSDTRTKVHFRHALSFAPIESFPDTDGDWPGVGWTHDTAWETAYRELVVGSAEQDQAGSAPPSGSRPPAPEPDFDRNRVLSYTHGPHTWGDLADYIGLVEAEMKRDAPEKGRKILAPEQISAEAVTYMLDLQNWLERWRLLASPTKRWEKLPNDQRSQFLSEISDISERHRRVLAVSDEIVSGLRKASNWKAAVSSSIPLTSPARTLGASEIVRFNIRDAIRAGLDPSDFYPLYEVDRAAPGPEVDFAPPTMPASPLDVAPGPGDQMLGYGATVQMTPVLHVGKVMLLQLFGSTFDGIGDAFAVMQFWIKPSDLRAKRFSRAFATADFS